MFFTFKDYLLRPWLVDFMYAPCLIMMLLHTKNRVIALMLNYKDV